MIQDSLIEELLMAGRDFSQSLYYPACGLDFEPLRRLSNLCDTFVYADWNQELGDVETAIQNLTDGLSLKGEPRVVDREEFGGRATYPPGFRLSAEERDSYERRFREVSAPRNPWAREFRLDRCFGGITREITLLYIAGEGLATYAAVYGQHGVAPLVLCTIQSGPGFGHGWTHLEQPGGTMEQLLVAYKELPRVWLRGKWGMPTEVGPGSWNRSVQNFGDWTQSWVEAFVRKDDDLDLANTVSLNDGDRNVTLVRQPWTRDDLDAFDGCFFTPRVAEDLHIHDRDNVRVWERSSSSIVEFLNWVGVECEREGWQRVAMIPVGYEDEGEYLRQWVKGSRLPRHLEIHFVNELDFADLRGWPSAQSGD